MRLATHAPIMTREQILAAEVFSYSFANYANHLGIGNLRFDKYMPETVRLLARAEAEGWTDERLAKEIEVDLENVPAWRRRYREALEIADAPTPAQAFRNGVRQALALEFKRHQLSDSELESAVTQVCYRAADLSYLLQIRREPLEKYSEELRREANSED